MADLGHNKNNRFPKPVEIIGGFLDDDVTTPIYLGDPDNKEAITVNKTLIGSKNEIARSVSFRQITINTQADFPDPAGGIIILENNINYVISQPTVVITSRLEIPSGGQVQISGAIAGSVLFYAGTGAMISGTNIDRLLLVDSTFASSDKMFDINGATSTQSFVNCNLSVFQAADMGGVTGITFFLINSVLQGFGQGFNFQNNPLVVILSANIVNTPNTIGCVYFSFSGTIPFISGINLALNSFGSNETLYDIDAALININGYFSGIIAAGPGTIFNSGSLDQTHLTFKFIACVNIADSTVKIQNRLDNNILVTDIPAQNAWVIVNGGTDFVSSLEERMTGITDGGATYTGLEDITALNTGIINFEPSTAAKHLAAAFMCIESTLFEATFTNATNIINRIGHTLSNGSTISFKNTAGTLPAELREDIYYFVVNVSADTFQVSYTLGGSAISFTDDGTPTNSFSLAINGGGIGRADIFALNSQDVNPSSLLNMKTGCQTYIIVSNETDAVDIKANYVYYNILK